MEPFQSTFPSRGTTLPEFVRDQSGLISIHVPLAGNDVWVRFPSSAPSKFQSTFPSRGTTCRIAFLSPSNSNFNPRSPRGERRLGADYEITTSKFQSTFPSRGTTLPEFVRDQSGLISIHVPLAGNDRRLNSTTIGVFFISIHVPLAGNDQARHRAHALDLYFNPRSPRGERPGITGSDAGTSLFQSTFPSRGTT